MSLVSKFLVSLGGDIFKIKIILQNDTVAIRDFIKGHIQITPGSFTQFIEDIELNFTCDFYNENSRDDRNLTLSSLTIPFSKKVKGNEPIDVPFEFQVLDGSPISWTNMEGKIQGSKQSLYLTTKAVSRDGYSSFDKTEVIILPSVTIKEVFKVFDDMHFIHDFDSGICEKSPKHGISKGIIQPFTVTHQIDGRFTFFFENKDGQNLIKFLIPGDGGKQEFLFDGYNALSFDLNDSSPLTPRFMMRCLHKVEKA